MKKLTDETEKELLEYYKNLPKELRILIFKDLFQVKEPEVLYNKFLLKIKKLINTRKKIDNHSKTDIKISDEEKKEIYIIKKALFKEEKRKKSSKKKQLLLKYKKIIEDLRNEGFSWRDIQAYLLKNYKFKIDVTYIHRIMKN